MDAKMAKRPGASAPKSPNVKKSLHLDPLADGLVEAFAMVRRTTLSEVVGSLLVAEYHRSQGSEREAVRTLLKHLGIEVPRRAASQAGLNDTDDPGQGRGAWDSEPAAPVVRIPTVTNRIGDIARKSAAPVDDALESLATD